LLRERAAEPELLRVAAESFLLLLCADELRCGAVPVMVRPEDPDAALRALLREAAAEDRVWSLLRRLDTRSVRDEARAAARLLSLTSRLERRSDAHWRWSERATARLERLLAMLLRAPGADCVASAGLLFSTSLDFGTVER